MRWSILCAFSVVSIRHDMTSAADGPFLRFGCQPEVLLAHLGKMRRREGGWTAAQDRELVFRYWQHLDDPTARPVKAIVVDEGRRSGRAIRDRVQKLRADPYLAALLPQTAPPCLHTFRDFLDIIFDTTRRRAFLDRGNTSTAPRPPASSLSVTVLLG